MSTTARLPRGAHCETVFVTANLNAGGAQRSLVNLACAIARRHALAVAVCGETTHEAFVQALHAAGVERFRPSAEGDDFAVAESLLAYAQRRAARTICFWNAAPGVKLLVAQFAPPELRLIDVSPGAYSFEEMDAVADFAQALAFTAERYYRRLDVLVLKYRTPEHPACRRVEVIPNGVALRDTAPRAPSVPRFLVSGRIAPSKRLEVVIEAFRGAQARHPGAELHIVGPVEERHASYADRLVAQAASLSVRFRGAGFDLAHLDEPWSAAVVLGTHQGSPNAVLEAMAAGIPVIANDSGGTRELVVDGATGWLLPEAADDAVLARAMHSVITNPEQARERAERALVLVRSHCSIEAMAARYLALLGTTRAHEKMGAWNSDSVPVAPPPSSSGPAPATAVR